MNYKTQMFEWYKKYCGFCIASGSNIPDCACTESGLFDTTIMEKCRKENCTPLKYMPYYE